MSIRSLGDGASPLLEPRNEVATGDTECPQGGKKREVFLQGHSCQPKDLTETARRSLELCHPRKKVTEAGSKRGLGRG